MRWRRPRTYLLSIYPFFQCSISISLEIIGKSQDLLVILGSIERGLWKEMGQCSYFFQRLINWVTLRTSNFSF